MRQQTDAIERLRDEVKQHRKQRERAEHGDERDNEPAYPEAAHEGQRHEEHERKPDPDRGAGEHDSPAGGLHRAHDRVLLRRPAAQLLAEAVDDEERVVDRDAEAYEHHQVLEVGGQLHEVGEDPDHPERDDDGGGREDERNEEGKRAEDEHEDEQRDRDGNEELADLQVFGEDGIEVVLDGRLAADEDLGAWDVARRGPHVVGVPLRVRRLEVGDDLGADHGVRDRFYADQLPRRELLDGALRGRPHLGDERLRRTALAADDDRERPGRLLPELAPRGSSRPARCRCRGARSGS